MTDSHIVYKTLVNEKRKHQTLSQFISYFLIFLSVSCLGWLWETIYFIIKDGELTDRGFLNLIWCPIYGTAILGIYFLMGTPHRPSGILKKLNGKNIFIRYSIYFILAIIIPSILELVVGVFFEYYFDLVLWHYTGNRFLITKFVSLEISLIWGLAITIGMRFLFDLLEKICLKMKELNLILFGTFLFSIFTADVLISFMNVLGWII